MLKMHTVVKLVNNSTFKLSVCLVCVCVVSRHLVFITYLAKMSLFWYAVSRKVWRCFLLTFRSANTVCVEYIFF